LRHATRHALLAGVLAACAKQRTPDDVATAYADHMAITGDTQFVEDALYLVLQQDPTP